MRVKSADVPFPQIVAPLPANFDTFTPEQQADVRKTRPLINCPDCKRTHKGRLKRCAYHKDWYR